MNSSTAEAATYYVSKNNTTATRNGLSWSTAWNDFDEIPGNTSGNWSTIQAGDTIFIDGGTSSLIYQDPIRVGRSGTSQTQRVRIIKSMETNRDGQAIIDGGRNDIPGCLAIGTEPTGNYSSALPYGIYINEKQHIVIDGSEWQGLVIRHTGVDGILLHDRSSVAETSDILVRNIEIHDTGNLNGYSAAVAFEGHDLTFENMKIWDNGEDGYHTPNIGVENVTIRRNWLYYTFPRFNSCRHADGMQIAHEYVNTGGTRDKINSGIYVYDSLFGPYIEHGMLFGEDTSNANRAQIRDAIIDNVTFYQGIETNGVMDYVFESAMAGEPRPLNWTFTNITAYRTSSQTVPVPAGSASSSVSIAHQLDIRESASTYNFSNSSYVNRELVFGVLPGTRNNNCQFNTTGDVIGTIANPQFTRPDVNIGSDNLWNDAELAQIDLTINNSVCHGSRITSAAALINLVNQSNGGQQPSITPSGPSPTSGPTATRTPTPTPLPATCFNTNTTSWTSRSFTPQSGTFSYVFDATPSTNPQDGVMGLSSAAATAFNSNAVIARFNPSGNIDAYNGTLYQAQTAIPYQPGANYRFRMVVNMGAKTYSVYVTPPGGNELTIGTNYGFRSEQATTTSLSFFNSFNLSGSQTLCNYELFLGDFNFDGLINALDYNSFIPQFNKLNCSFNLADTCQVNIYDFNALVSHF